MEFIEGEFYQFKGPKFTQLIQEDYVLQYVKQLNNTSGDYIFKVILANIDIVKGSRYIWSTSYDKQFIGIPKYALSDYTITKL